MAPVDRNTPSYIPREEWADLDKMLKIDDVDD